MNIFFSHLSAKPGLLPWMDGNSGCGLV